MIAVTGANGYLGNNLVRLLLERGHRVRCITRSTSDLRSLQGLDIDLAISDVRDRDGLRRALAPADLVFHLAAMVSVCPSDARLMQQVNADGARNVAEVCLELGGKRLCHVSSSHALKPVPRGQVLDERQPFDPHSAMAYGRTKAVGAGHVLSAVARGLDAVIACPVGLVGPFDFEPSEIGKTVIAYARGRLRAYVPGGYSFADVRDVAEGLCELARCGRAGQHYILGGERLTVKQVIHCLGRIVGTRGPVIGVPGFLAAGAARAAVALARVSGTRPPFTTDTAAALCSNPRFSHEQAARELGYCPRPVEDSLRDMVKWFRDRGMI